MLNKGLFLIAHQLIDARFYKQYKSLINNQKKSAEELKNKQEEQLRRIIKFSYDSIPYYHRLFTKLNLTSSDIKKLDDLEKLPILTKDIIKNNIDDFKPVNIQKVKYYTRATGGSTGTPFRYRLDRFDRLLAGTLSYRGWGYGGYELGDKMVFLAGSSLNISSKTKLSTHVDEAVRNIKKLSSYDMGNEEVKGYVSLTNKFKPKFIRGYASSLYFWAKWIEDNNLNIHQPLAIFTTAEKLYPKMRQKIEDVFNCDVYDGYGLNDGGVSAYECSEHLGLHIDTERSIMEISDEDGNQLNAGEGTIIATSLHNYSMPFIRYDTGDIGYIIEDNCPCGRPHKLLKEIKGRQYEMLYTPEGKAIFGGFFTTQIFDEISNIKSFQVIQKAIDKLIIRIVVEKDLDDSQLNQIREIAKKKSESWSIQIDIVPNIETTNANKYKFIINELNSE